MTSDSVLPLALSNAPQRSTKLGESSVLVVLSGVLAARHDATVLRRIIRFILVHMVHDLIES